MPEKQRFEPQDNLTGQDFSFRKNKDMAAQQANETFVVDARFNRSLGQNGEVLGFAKKQFSNDSEVQALRTAAYEELESAEQELRSQKEVKKWLADRREIEGMKGGLVRAREQLDEATEQLEALKRSEGPHVAAKVQEAEDRVGKLSEDLGGLRRDFELNAEQKYARLIEDFKKSPVIQEYVATLQASKSAFALNQSIGNIAQASSVLYENNQEMTNENLGGDRQLLARAVASYEVDKMIGLNVCAEEKFGLDTNGGLVGISVQCDGAGVRSAYGTNPFGETMTTFLDIDYSEPKVQKGLYDLQTLDYITGQCDRHAGNMFVDPDTGKVTGIDNDLAFPEVDLQTVMANDGQLAGKFIAEMPKMIHAETAEKIAAINPEEFRKHLAAVRPPNGDQGLGQKELDGAVSRLMDLQKAIAGAKNGTGDLKIVAEFNKETYESAVQAQIQGDGSVTSYVGAVHNEKTTTARYVQMGSMAHGMRDASTVGKAKINPEYASFRQQMTPAQQADYRAMQAEVDKLEVKLGAVRKELAKLDHPGMKDKLAALKHGGVDGARKHFMAQETALVSNLNSRMNGLKLMAAPHVEAYEQAQAQARTARPPQKETASNQQPTVDQDNLANGPESPKAAKNKIPAKDQQAAPSVHAAEDGQDVTALDDLDDNEVDLKQEGLKKSPSVGEMLKRSQSAPALSQGVEGPKPGGKSLRESGKWQSAQHRNPAPKQGVNPLPASRL